MGDVVKWTKVKNGRHAAQKFRGGRLISAFFYSANCPDNKHYNLYYYEHDLLFRFSSKETALMLFNSTFNVTDNKRKKAAENPLLKSMEILYFEKQVKSALNEAVRF